MTLGILIVEDDKVQREMMRDSVAEKHPGVIIDTAETVNEAVALIRSAMARGVHYIVVILDIKLPRELGGREGFHLNLRDQVLAFSASDTYIFYQSAHLDDQVIQEYKRGVEAQTEKNVQAPRTLFFSKVKPEDVRQLYEKVDQVMHTRRISQKLEGIMPAPFSSPWFGPVVAGDMAHVAPREAFMAHVAPREAFTYASTDPTHQLADLARDIEAHWNYIEPNLKERIRQYFVVTETDTGVDVSLL
jgi:CheY-like chemotaxis protein